MTKFILVFTIALSSFLLPQQKYFIYFKDKGFDNKNSLNKSSLLYKEAVNSLSPKAIERRLKTIGEEIVTYDDLPVNRDYIDQLEKNEIKIVHQLSWFNAVSAILSDEQIEKVKSLLFVKSIEPVKKLYFVNDELDESNPERLVENYLYKISDNLSLTYGNSYKQLNLSDIPFIHSKGIDGSGVIVGLLDSGFDWKKHESLTDRNVIAEFDFIFNDTVTANETDDSPIQDRHGTLIFSLIGGFKDSVLIGAAFNSSYLLAKTEDVRSETHIEEDNYAAALIWMESLGVDITSSSLGYNTFDSGYSYTYNDMDGETAIVTKAAELSFQRGVSTFTSAGNEGNTSWRYITAPADGFNIIAVGAVNEFGTVASFSSTGPTFDGRIKPDLAAYGVSGFGAIAGTISSYGTASGTSISSPIAAGVAALLLSAHPHLDNTQIRSILLETSSNSQSPNNQIGYGIISAKKSIEFPNIRKSGNTFEIIKTIFDKGVDPQTVQLAYGFDDIMIPPSSMTNFSEYYYSFELPQISPGKEVEFYISYADSLDNNYRVPESGFFKFFYGLKIISLNLNPVEPGFEDEISDFFPNPFQAKSDKSVSIYFSSVGNEEFTITITDVIGRKVFDYSKITSFGQNSFSWNGKTNDGYLCASGVYLALIKIGDQQYSKKIILIK